MSALSHHVVIGSGIAGAQAVATLRARDPDARVTMITLSALHCYKRYDLPRIFRGCRDWRELLAQPPSYYDDQRITVRRATKVANVDTSRGMIQLSHNEEIRFDTLLVASGCRGHLPEELADYKDLIHRFSTFQDAMTVARALPEGGRVIMLGGDMLGLDLARTLIDTGHRVTLIAGEHTFWPHPVTVEQRDRLMGVLHDMGIEVVDGETVGGGIAAIEAGPPGMPARRVVFRDGGDRYGDIVMSFFGLVPSVEFMLGAGLDIERGILVNPSLRTTDERIYAAGDVCQIWSDQERSYRFFYGWKNVRAMGDIAARNMTGAAEAFVPAQDEGLAITPEGQIHSPFWEYE